MINIYVVSLNIPHVLGIFLEKSKEFVVIKD